MKNVLLLSFLIASTGAAQAQSIAAGTISLGGSIGYNRQSDESQFPLNGNSVNEERTTSSFQFSPSAGYFVADNLAVGLSLGYSTSRTAFERTGPGSTNQEGANQGTSFRVGPYVQYYKMLSEQFGVLGTLGAGYVGSSSENNDVTISKARGGYASLTPAVIFFPIPKFGISASIGNLGYERQELKSENSASGVETSVSGFGASFGLNQLLLGGTYYFGR